MPAYRERVYLCPGKSGQPAWVGEFPIWWNRREFFEKYGERGIDTGNPIYVDYGLLLTQWEAAAWDKQCRETFARDARSRHAGMREEMQEWETLLKAAHWVIVESYEWESGLDG